MKNIAVIGAGSWGTALASVLASNNHSVSMWSHSSEVANEITNHHTNVKYLKNATLSSKILCSTSMELVLKEVELVLFVVPSHAMREVVRQTVKFLKGDELIVHATKGIELNTSMRMSEVLKEELPMKYHHKIGVLSGPSHAEEVICRKPTTIALSIKSNTDAKTIQALFSNDMFRVYTNDDIIGVELGGTLKNIIAIGAGLSDGLEYGDNAKAALLTRGLAEISRLGIHLGAKQSTFRGLTGIGDLIVTGNSIHSRNWKTGNLLAKGYTLEEISKKLGMVSEGVLATKATYFLAQNEQIEMPIVNELYHVLFEQKDPKKAVLDLMSREFKEED